MNEKELLERITYNPEIFGGKPIIRGQRLAVEHVLTYLAMGMGFEEMLDEFPRLEREDILACLLYAQNMVARETAEPFLSETGS